MLFVGDETEAQPPPPPLALLWVSHRCRERSQFSLHSLENFLLVQGELAQPVFKPAQS